MVKLKTTKAKFAMQKHKNRNLVKNKLTTAIFDRFPLYRVGSTDVCPVTVARNLGSWFDEHLTMSTHISKLCGVAFYHLHNIKRIRKYLSRESTEMLVHNIIIIIIIFHLYSAHIQ